jgi:uncharacterized protein YvpB
MDSPWRIAVLEIAVLVCLVIASNRGDASVPQTNYVQPYKMPVGKDAAFSLIGINETTPLFARSFPQAIHSTPSVFTLAPSSTEFKLAFPQTGRTPEPLPWKAYVDPVYGQRQQLNLDCESRAAVDWAVFFQTRIDELEFFHGIPPADNPNHGFVGDVNDYWGRLPPNGYGVYAGPVARVLRTHGVSAFAYRGLTYDQLRRQAASGHPVIVWVIGHIGLSKPIQMELDGELVVVAPFEHTVLFIGYEYQKAIVLDGSNRYRVSEVDFLNSWKILGNMAIVAEAMGNEGESEIPFQNLAEE